MHLGRTGTDEALLSACPVGGHVFSEHSCWRCSLWSLDSDRRCQASLLYSETLSPLVGVFEGRCFVNISLLVKLLISHLHYISMGLWFPIVFSTLWISHVVVPAHVVPGPAGSLSLALDHSGSDPPALTALALPHLQAWRLPGTCFSALLWPRNQPLL